MSAATSHMDDVNADRTGLDGDGKSTVDLYATPDQLGQPDGESSIDLSDYIGGDRVLESVKDAAGDNTVVLTSEPTSKSLDSAHKQSVPSNVDAPLSSMPTSSVENLASGVAPLSGKSVTTTEAPKTAAKRGRPSKAEQAAKEANADATPEAQAKAVTEAEPSTPAAAEQDSTAK